MDAYEAEGMAVAAAKILLSLRNRKLRQWPEWAPRPSEEPGAAADLQLPLDVWPKRRRSPLHALPKEKSKAAAAWALAAQNLGAPLGYGAGAGSGASSSGEDVPRSLPRAREKPKAKVELMAARMTDTPLYYGAAAGSGPTTSGVDLARSRSRPRSSEKAQATKVGARKEAMAATSPETPLDYAAAAAGSGASSSGEDWAGSPAKRKAPGAGGSGGASSGDEGCSSPAKRTRPDAAAGDGAGQATVSAVKGTAAAAKIEEPKIQHKSSPNRDENGMLLFDLNEDLNILWED